MYLFCAGKCSGHQNKTIFGAKQENSCKNGENTKVNKQLVAIFGLIEENMDLSLILIKLYLEYITLGCARESGRACVHFATFRDVCLVGHDLHSLY
jgi:hypothetical protein